MCESCFTIADYDLLLDLLVPFDAAFSKLSPHFDALLKPLGEKMLTGEVYESFSERRAAGISRRAVQYLNLTINHNLLALALLHMPLAEVLKKIPNRFPEMLTESARVMWETLNAVVPREDSFEVFLAEHKLRRQVFNSTVKGAG